MQEPTATSTRSSFQNPDVNAWPGEKPRAPWASWFASCGRGNGDSPHGRLPVTRLLLLLALSSSVLHDPGQRPARAQDTVPAKSAQNPGGNDASKSTSAKPTSVQPTPASSTPDRQAAAANKQSPLVAEPSRTGGEADGVVQVANLVYAGTKSSQCFADHFLIQAEQQSSISTSRRFHAIKLSSEELYNFPLVIMTGEGDFQLTDRERENLARYIERGGFLLASAGCSSQEWDRAFRKEMALLFRERPLAAIAMDHSVFHTVSDVKELQAKHGKPRPLEGISIGTRLGVLYSQDGLNDTAHTKGCCCCGGNEIINAIDINVNILAYALTH